MKTLYFCYLPKSATVEMLQRKLLNCINYYMYSVRREKTIHTGKIRLWITNMTELEELAKIDQKYMNYTHATIDATLVNASEEMKKFKVDDLNFIDDDCFIIETEKDGKFVLKKQEGDEEESKDGIAAEIREMAEEA